MKKIILSVVLFLFISTSFCQSFMHGAGITILGGYTKGGDFTFAEGFTYSPRFNFVETEKLSVSVGIPLSIGISASTTGSYDYYTDTYNESIGFVFNAPVVISLNMGRGSTNENRDKFGYFVGAGYGYHHGSFISTDDYDQSGLTSSNENNFGPTANAGLRFGVGRKHKNIELRFSYFKGLNDKKPNIFGIAGLFNF
ncbi:MAG: hypothetical protein ABI741_07160 [Ferruginibacter sp.]